MKMSNKLYNFLKYFLITFVPALITLISALGTIYHFNTETITLTIGVVATFLGAITGISCYNYNKDKEEK